MSNSAVSAALSKEELGNILNRSTLRFSADLKLSRPHAERVVAKYQPGRRYLVLTPAQLRLLEEFGTGRTVMNILCGAIGAQRCPSLREFYELVVKAVRAGVLQTDGQPVPPEMKPARWFLRIPGAVVRWLTPLSALAMVVSLFLRPVKMPEHPVWLLLGWLAALAAFSLGPVLAASVLRSGGGEPYRPRFAWKTLVPGFRIDCDDVIMQGRDGAVNVALARLLPLFLFMAAAAWFAPELEVPLVIALLWELSPVWPSPVHELVRALYRDPQLTTSYDFVFARDRLFTLLRRARQQLADGRYLAASALATIGWLLIVFLSGCGLLQANATELVRRFQTAGGWRYTALGLLVLLALLVLAAAGAALSIVVSHVRALARERAERRHRPETVLVSEKTIAEWLGRTLLFRELPVPDLWAIAAVVKPEEHRRGSYVVREGEPGARLYVILSGRFEVRRDIVPGRSEPVAEIGEGDVFGEIALLQGGIRTRSVRALGRGTVLGLDQADFERLVLSHLSRQAVEDAVQKVGFLQHAPLTRHWSHALMTSFARRAKFQEMKEGDVVLEEGSANHWFYLVHRGEFEVSLKGQVLRRLKLGDSFGELSLMGDGFVTARVVVRSKVASCLTINGRDFLEFITQDFAVGILWEETKTRRLERLAVTTEK